MTTPTDKHRALLEAATPRPWKAELIAKRFRGVPVWSFCLGLRRVFSSNSDVDKELIESAVNTHASLLDDHDVLGNAADALSKIEQGLRRIQCGEYPSNTMRELINQELEK